MPARNLDRSLLEQYLARCAGPPHDHATFRPDPDVPLWCQNADEAGPALHGCAGQMHWRDPEGVAHEVVIMCYCGRQFAAEHADILAAEDNVFRQLVDHATPQRSP